MNRKKVVVGLIIIGTIAVIAMYAAGIGNGNTSIKDINKNPAYLGKEVTISGTLTQTISDAASYLYPRGGVRTFTVYDEKSPLKYGGFEDIQVSYRGEMPSEPRPYVPGSVTKIEVTGIVKNKNPQIWIPYIEGISWEYI